MGNYGSVNDTVDGNVNDNIHDNVNGHVNGNFHNNVNVNTGFVIDTSPYFNNNTISLNKKNPAYKDGGVLVKIKSVKV